MAKRKTGKGRGKDEAAAVRADRQREALAYRRMGCSYREIAAAMEITAATAAKYVAQAIKQIPPPAADVPDLMRERLDAMMECLMDAVDELHALYDLLDAGPAAGCAHPVEPGAVTTPRLMPSAAPG
jgi:hypothetical protein